MGTRGDKSYGELTFRKALETSNNLVTLKVGLDLGLNSVNEFLYKIIFIIQTPLPKFIRLFWNL